MRGPYGTILVFLLSGAGFVFINILISRLIQPHYPSPEKLATYECGEDPKGSARIRYNFRFYTIALTFIIFEAEILFMFPWAIIFRDNVDAGTGAVTFIKGILFIAILFLGLIYAWAKGDLDWVKPKPAYTSDDVDMPPQAVFNRRPTPVLPTPETAPAGE